MLKTMSIALLAASILAAPALAASPATANTAAHVAQTRTSKMTTGEVTSPAGKRHLRKVVRHHQLKHRSFAHRHHMQVSKMHASAKRHGAAKTRLGLNKARHVTKAGHKIGFNQRRTTGPRLSAKRTAPALRRG